MQVDVTRNERKEVLFSVALPKPSGIIKPELVIWSASGAIQVAIRCVKQPDLYFTFPQLPKQAIQWLKEVPPFRPSVNPEDRIEGDTRIGGGRYVLVCEVVGEEVAAGYFAPVTVARGQAAAAG